MSFLEYSAEYLFYDALSFLILVAVIWFLRICTSCRTLILLIASLLSILRGIWVRSFRDWWSLFALIRCFGQFRYLWLV